VRGGKAVTGWLKSGGTWYYLGTDGKMKTGWVKDDNKWYRLGTNGAMKTGWVNVNGSWYYFNANGVMQRGWQLIDGQWYHLNEETGIMSTNVWLYKDGVWYYVNASGVMTQGAQWNGVFENGVYIELPRLKRGDGQTKLNDLPFLEAEILSTGNEINYLYHDEILEFV
jgi:glucan-binding YG repeat protein